MKKEIEDTIIIGAGMTGLAAGYQTGYPVYEAGEYPGGICSSYYIRPGETRRLASAPGDGEAYRFEIGGGHWIFGADPDLLNFIESLTPVQTYLRKAAVFFREKNKFVPYPIQNHLRYLEPDQVRDIIREIESAGEEIPRTMNDWLLKNFGPTLGDLFFGPFHQMYTAGLYQKIAPQDAYKSPVDIATVIRGASGGTGPVGYNAQFAYPVSGLDTLARKLAEKAVVRYKKRAVRLDVDKNAVHFADGTVVSYRKLISTLPLNRAMEISGLTATGTPEPYSSVLELNIGARKGPNCPEDHWLYIPDSRSEFFRVGFYSNVDTSFLPRSRRDEEDRVGIYVERAYPGGEKPDEEELAAYKRAVEEELRGLGFIGEVEINDHTWIEVAYTWSWPENPWKEEALKVLAENDILQAGRYARWGFQGIAVSIKEGLSLAGAL